MQLIICSRSRMQHGVEPMVSNLLLLLLLSLPAAGMTMPLAATSAAGAHVTRCTAWWTRR
jgi:hypothetical protein